METTNYPQLKLTQVVSKNGATKRQIANLKCLGIHRLHETVIVEKNPVVAGMVAKVQHLLKIEEI